MTRRRSKTISKAEQKKRKQLKQHTGRSLLELERLRTKVTTANRRLRNLEKAGFGTKAYKHIEKLAYIEDKAITRTKSGDIKFRTDISKLNYNELEHLENVVEVFLSRKSSTVRGTKEYYGTLLDKINKKYGTNLTDIDILNVFDSAQEVAGVTIYSSQVVEETIAKLGEEWTEEDITNFMFDNMDKPYTEVSEDMEFIQTNNVSYKEYESLFANAFD